MKLLTVGDSFTSRITAKFTWPVWAEIVADQHSLALDNRAVGGSGHCSQGIYDPPSRWMRQVVRPPAAPADVAVAFGSCNDRWYDPEQVRLAAVETYYGIRAANPGAPLIVIGPQWGAGEPDASMDATRTAVRAAADEVGVDYYADPIGNSWLTGRWDLMDTDQFHPNAAGHRHLANIMADILRPFV